MVEKKKSKKQKRRENDEESLAQENFVSYNGSNET